MNQDATPQTTPTRPVLIDAHVHLYDCYDRATFFDAALSNFSNAAQTLGLPRDTPGVLMLTETAKDTAFQSLTDQRGLDSGRWRFTAHKDELSITASIEDRDALTIIAGKQIATGERLEVLALGTSHTFTEGLALRHTIQKVDQYHGLPVLPFGVGKWSGKRGEFVDSLIHDESFPIRFMLGDNAGRLALAGEPKPFAQARQKNIWTLPGTDPLPFKSQAQQVGRFGMVLDTGFDPAQPADSIKAALKSLASQPTAFGRANSLISFFSLQVAMQIHKRLQ